MAATTPVVGGSFSEALWSTYILRKFVPGLKAELLFANYAERASIPAGAGGRVARWNVPQMRNGSTVVLTAGAIVTETAMVDVVAVENTIADYGEHFRIDDLAKETQVSTALDAYKDIVTYAGATAIDQLVYNAAVATSGFLHCTDTVVGGATLGNAQQFKLVDVPVITGYFRGNNAKGWDNLSKDFMLAIHPDMEFALVTDVTTTELSWNHVNKHVPEGFDQLINNHRFVGRFNGLSILRTTMIGTVDEDVDAYRCLALARWGVGWAGLGAKGPMTPTIKMKSPGPNSTNDPLDQIHTLGWKVRATGKLLQNETALVVYSSVT